MSWLGKPTRLMINYLEEYQMLVSAIENCLAFDPEKFTASETLDEITLVLDIFKELVPGA